MTPHHSLSDADVDAIEARARWARTTSWSHLIAREDIVSDHVPRLCAEVRRLRAALAAVCFPAFECEHCGDTADVVPVTLARGEAADGAWLCRDRAACQEREAGA